MLAGVVTALVAIIAGIASTGVSPGYFFQPAGVLIVLGGLIGVTMVTTPRRALLNSFRRVLSLVSTPVINRQSLIDEIAFFAAAIRTNDVHSLELLIEASSDSFLRDGLLFALDAKDRSELQSTLETELRLRERQGEADAKTLEVAGAFAPTMGILGTVIGLIEVLRQFSNLQSVGSGIGTAFVSTIYGLVLANFLLLPMAHRIRTRIAESFELQEMMIEGVMCVRDRVHPLLVRQRLAPYLREDAGYQRTVRNRRPAVLAKSLAGGA